MQDGNGYTKYQEEIKKMSTEKSTTPDVNSNYTSCKLWQIICYSMVPAVGNFFMIVFTMNAYIAKGGYGLATALAASGAHIVLFTTGRGTPFACPVPTVKISTNNLLAEKKKNWIDFNCGVLVDDTPADELADHLLDFVINIASGKKSKSEEAGFHDMAIFKQGVTL